MTRSLCLVAVLLGAMVSCSVADPEVVCPPADVPPQKLLSNMDALLEMCIIEHYDQEETESLMNPATEETSRLNLRRYCNTTSKVEACFDLVTKYAKVCLASAPHQLFKYTIHVENWRNGLGIACSDLGERVAVFLSAASHLRPKKACGSMFTTDDSTPFEASKSTLRFYHNVQAYRQCVAARVAQQDFGLSNTIASLMADILAELKCAASDNVTVKLCSTLDNTTTDN